MLQETRWQQKITGPAKECLTGPGNIQLLERPFFSPLLKTVLFYPQLLYAYYLDKRNKVVSILPLSTLHKKI